MGFRFWGFLVYFKEPWGCQRFRKQAEYILVLRKDYGTLIWEPPIGLQQSSARHV